MSDSTQLYATTAGKNGFAVQKTALLVYDFSVDGGTAGTFTPTSAPSFPNKSVVYLESYDVLTAPDSAAHTATISLQFPTDGTLIPATIVSAATAWGAGPKSLIGITPGFTPAPVKLTAARQPTMTIAGQNLTQGKIVFQITYWISQ